MPEYSIGTRCDCVCKVSYNQTVLLFLDFEKAFDSIEWQFIWRTLNKYKFGPTFITCVKTLLCRFEDNLQK